MLTRLVKIRTDVPAVLFHLVVIKLSPLQIHRRRSSDVFYYTALKSNVDYYVGKIVKTSPERRDGADGLAMTTMINVMKIMMVWVIMVTLMIMMMMETTMMV